jgi:hypothetical protein
MRAGELNFLISIAHVAWKYFRSEHDLYRNHSGVGEL